MFGMKAYLINMQLLVLRSRSSAKVKVKYNGYISQKVAVSGAFVFHKHIILKFCQVHFSKTILAMVMKFRGWVQLGGKDGCILR